MKSMDLDDITGKLYLDYKIWKTGEKGKERFKDEFFAAAEEEIKKTTLARKTIRVVASSSEDARTHGEQYFSKWLVIDIEQLKEDYFSVTLEENPKYLPFVYVNHENKMVFTKQISEQGALVDDDALKEKDPELWEEISYVPERQLKSLDELSSDQLTKLQEYIYRPKPKVSLPAPRKAKPEELEE